MNLFPFDIMTNVLFLSLPIFSTAQLVHVLTVAVVESGLPASSNKDVKFPNIRPHANVAQIQHEL